MRMSYAVPHVGGRFYFPSRVREWLQIPRTCLLHGRLVSDTDDPAVILSPIPVQDWHHCFKVTINTSAEIGSLYTALEALTTSKLNILHMISAATSGAGEGTLAVIVGRTTQQRNQRPTRVTALPRLPRPIAERLKDQIHQYMERSNALSTSALYSNKRATQLETVRVLPLLVLRALAMLEPPRKSILSIKLGATFVPEFQISMKNGLIDFGGKELARCNGVTSQRKGKSVFDCLMHHGVRKSLSMMVTADTEDYHFRLALLPSRPYMTINIPLSVQSKDTGGTIGTTKEIIKLFNRDHNHPVNIYYASSSIIAHEHRPKKKKLPYSESVKIKLVGDVEGMMTTSRRDGCRVGEDISKAIKDRMMAVSRADKNRSISITAYDDPDHTNELERITFKPLLAPLVFTATNAKEGMKAEYLRMAIDLIALLKNLHLRPVFVDTLTGAESARRQMTDLLDVSPMLVSLHLPEEGTRLTVGGKKTLTGQISRRFAPSAWTTFEEAYITSHRHRHVFRMIHKDVFPPPFLEPTLDITFSTEQEFERKLKVLRGRILTCIESDTWRKALAECGRALAEQRVDLEQIELSDPEEWIKEKLDLIEKTDGTKQGKKRVTNQKETRNHGSNSRKKELQKRQRVAKNAWKNTERRQRRKKKRGRVVQAVTS